MSEFMIKLLWSEHPWIPWPNILCFIDNVVQPQATGGMKLHLELLRGTATIAIIERNKRTYTRRFRHVVKKGWWFLVGKFQECFTLSGRLLLSKLIICACPRKEKHRHFGAYPSGVTRSFLTLMQCLTVDGVRFGGSVKIKRKLRSVFLDIKWTRTKG